MQKISFFLFSNYLESRMAKGGKLLSKTAAYGGCHSALMFLFKQSWHNPDENATLCAYMTGWKNQIASQKQSSGQRLDEGKKPTSFQAYKLMARKILESDNKQDALFAHAFFGARV
jgi:hypothetical protein